MKIEEINNCPGSLKKGYTSYSSTCLKKMFHGRKVKHILPYPSPNSDFSNSLVFDENRKNISISGVQEKFSVLLEKNKLRLISEGEKGTYILKPIPSIGNRRDQMPANEHLTMQLAQQVFGIKIAENALIFFNDGTPAYLTKRFDINENGIKIAQIDFATLDNRTPQIHGADYKYQGNYLELFTLLREYVPTYIVEAPRLLKLIIFNYLFSNGDAHYKNFSLQETQLGDYRLSPAYDLLNSRIHVDDQDFALNDGLLPGNKAQGKIREQFILLSKEANIPEKTYSQIISFMLNQSQVVEQLIATSFLNDKTKRNYLQAYQRRWNKMSK